MWDAHWTPVKVWCPFPVAFVDDFIPLFATFGLLGKMVTWSTIDQWDYPISVGGYLVESTHLCWAVCSMPLCV